MKFTIPALIACATPLAATSYSFGPLSNRSFRIASTPSCTPLSVWSPRQTFDLLSPSSMIDMRRRQNALFREASKQAFQNVFQNYSPGYQVIDNDEKFQVSIEVPGVKSEDLSIKVEEDGKYLTVSGSREKTATGYSYSSKFSQSFYLDPSIETDKISADLQNGILLVTAPKDLKKIEDSVKTIPIKVITDAPVEVKTDANDAHSDNAKETEHKTDSEIHMTAEEPV
ncbi:Hsp20/alpha crystallin family [Fragilaria crotonensis]|nr:Hsp20/alpha crystallin family [Fragilaria crotonensis]